METLRRTFEIAVKWVYFPLHPTTPPEGLSLDRLFAGRGVDLEAMYVRMKRLMDAEGLPYGRRTHTYNSRLAQELAKWADTLPGFEQIHDALYRAYFVDGRNIGDREVLLALAKSVGLSMEAARRTLDDRLFKNAVDADWAKAQSYGVTGVPTFIANGRGVVGAQPYEVLEQLVDAVGARRRSENSM
ncbi:MAG: hypothetical protein C5B57_03150 [Blastocatellia bacterium]|nr:MAG: hypothetical protein C5B57_03150 [Blastocatellia bacterium]